MPLTHLVEALPGLQHSEIKEVVHRPGWLLAQSCSLWHGEPKSDTDIAELLLVYRSPLVTDTKKMYAPVLDRILRAEVLDVLFATELEDEAMMHGTGELTIFRFSKPGRNARYTVEQMRDAMSQIITHHNDGDLVS